MRIAATLVTSLVFMSCGAFDDNSQPEIDTITDQTLYVGDEMKVELNIIDEDTGDTHVINVSSDNTIVATASVSDTTLTIIGINSRDGSYHSFCH